MIVVYLHLVQLSVTPLNLYASFLHQAEFRVYAGR